MEEKKEQWLNYLAIITVLLALSATLSTLKVGSFSNRSILSQTQASNQWAYYQAKSIKGYLYEIQKDKLQLELKLLSDNSPKGIHEEFEKRIAFYTNQIARYEKEKADIEQKARDFESKRDVAQVHSQIFGMAVIFLQLAILLSSIAALMKKKPVWALGLVLGGIGCIYFANGFWLFF
jgi:hypothetical protein